MSKYGFEYALNRMNLLNEMARPVTTFGETCNNLKCTYQKILSHMESIKIGPPKNAGAQKRQTLAQKFIIDALNDFTERYKEVDEDGKPTGELMGVLQIVRGLTGATDKGAVKKAAEEFAKSEAETAKSQDFLNYIGDVNNIETFLRNAGEYDTPDENLDDEGGSTIEMKSDDDGNFDGDEYTSKLVGASRAMPTKSSSNRKAGKAKIMMNVINMTPNEYEKLGHQMIPMVKKIKEEEKKSQAGGVDTQDTPNDFESYTTEFFDGLESKLIRLPENSPEYKNLSSYIQQLEGLISNNTIQTPDQLKNIFNKLQNTGKISGIIQNAFEHAFNQADSGMVDVNDTSDYDSQTYGELDPAIVNKVFDRDTDSLMEFQRWLKATDEWNDYLKSKQEVRQSGIDKGKFEHTPEAIKKLRSVYQKLQNPNLTEPVYDELVSQYNKALQYAHKYGFKEHVWDLPSEVPPFEQLQGEVSDKAKQDKIKELENLVRDFNVPVADRKRYKQELEALQSPVNEGVMVYMTEQVEKDRLFNGSQRGVFKDRGYKKFQNYNHWLNYNS